MSADASRRWTPEEYVARFKYSQTLRGLLAESESDRHFYDWYVGRPFPDVEVLPGYVIRYSRELLDQLGLRSGVKGMLLSVAIGLTAAGIGRHACVVVDRDDDGRSVAPADHAVVTDMWSLEMYAFSPEVLNDFMGMHFAAAHQVSGTALFERVEPVVRWAACARSVLRSHSPSVGMIGHWLSYVDTEADPPAIRATDILRESLRDAGRTADAEAVRVTTEAVEELLDSDAVTADIARGHDFSDVLLAVMKGKALASKGIKIKTWDRDMLEGALRSVLDREYLEGFAMFQELEGRWTA